MSQRRFCLMTFGRTGSTWLMRALAEFPDVAVPAKNVDSPDNELFYPRMPAKYAALTGRPVQSELELIEAFFAYNAASQYAGFKSMPNRHKAYDQFVQRRDVSFIVLERRDISSTVASFLLANKHGTWRREGGKPEQTLAFTPDESVKVEQNVAFIVECKLRLASIRGALRLYYEDLCQPGWESPKLDAYFGRPVRLPAPKAPTEAREYLENWDEFRSTVERAWTQLLARLPAHLRALL